jgi:hypothetical protein
MTGPRLTQQDVCKACPILDTTNFDPKNPLHSDEKKGQFGLFKSVVGDKVIREVIAISPKVYLGY